VKALDTNVLVRYLIADDKDMAEKALRLLKNAQSRHTSYLVTTLVLLETLWVLRSRYGLERGEICEAVSRLENLSGIRLENPELIRNFLAQAREGNLELADLLIALDAHACGAETVVTFDRKAARSALFEAIP